MGGQEENQNTLLVAIMMRLQQEFEILKKNNEEELSMLIAENAYIKRKLNEEIVLSTTLFETIQPRARILQRTYNEASFEATRRKQPKTSGTLLEYL